MDWIPVTERLPEVSQIIDSTNLILVTVLGSSGKTFVTAMRYVKRTIRNKCVYRWEWDGIISPWEVVAWKPLPEAWKLPNSDENGGVLMRLIDANNLMDHACRDRLDSRELIWAMIENAPTVDAVPVVHGHWVGEDYDGYADGNPVYYTYRCSECGKLFETDDEPIDFDYCPRCGAKMDEKDGEKKDE